MGMLVLMGSVAPASAQVTVFVTKPAFVNDLSKRTDDLIGELRRHSKKEVTLVSTAAEARVVVELVSVTLNHGAQQVNDVATAVTRSFNPSASAVHESGDTYTATVRLCVPAQNHCEELAATDGNESVAAMMGGVKVRKFVKDNAAALQ